MSDYILTRLQPTSLSNKFLECHNPCDCGIFRLEKRILIARVDIRCKRAEILTERADIPGERVDIPNARVENRS